MKSITIDLLSKSMAEDPYRIYKMLRESYPVCKVEQGGWAISNYKDVFHVLTKPNIFSSKGCANLLQPAWLADAGIKNYCIVFEDRPEHTIHRSLVSKYFTKKYLEQLVPFMHELTSSLINNLFFNSNSVSIDVLRQLAYPYVDKIIASIVGINDEHFFLRCRKLVCLIENPPVSYDGEYLKEFNELSEYVNSYLNSLLCAYNNQKSEGTLIKHLQCSNSSVETLSELLELIVITGMQSTPHLISRSILYLSSNLQLTKELVQKRHKLPLFVDELLRYDSPTHIAVRITKQSIKIHDVNIPKNTPIYMLLASANRDPLTFELPEYFDMARSNLQQHISFGVGHHRCLGEWLTKTETIAFLDVFLSSVTILSCDKRKRLPWFYSLAAHTFDQLNVELRLNR